MSAAPRWAPLLKGGFTGTEWQRTGALEGYDPYLVWAEACGLEAPTRGANAQTPKWLPIVIELTPTASVSALVDASSARWLQVPPVYLHVPGLLYCSARVAPDFFKHLRTRHAFKQLIERFELGLPVDETGTGSDVHRLHQGMGNTGGEWRVPPQGQLTGKVLGLIDGGLALAQAAFLNAQGRARVKHFWRQDSMYDGPWPAQNHQGSHRTPLDPQRAGTVPADLGYGHELDAAAINAAMAQCTPPGGRFDEAALYRHLQLWNLACPINHGTHVMSLAAGSGIPHMPGDSAASRCDLVAVQLNWSNVLDTSGGPMNVSVLDSLMYILARCAPSAQVVVNISWGTLAGPHDGTSVLEAAMDQLIALYAGRLQITVPAGNAYQSRTHANDTLQPGESVTLHWRTQPDDHTQSFLELWFCDPALADELVRDVCISVRPPGHGAATEALPVGSGGVWPSAQDPQCALLFPQHSALGRQGTCALMALAPSFSHNPRATTAPFGVWHITLTNHGLNPLVFDGYVERDDVALGQRTGARQSYFEDRHYDTSGNLGSFVDDPANPTPIRRSGTFNSLSTGKNTVSVGGTRRNADAWSRFARYSPQAPDPDAARPQRPGVKKVPDQFMPSDDSPVQWGVLGAATTTAGVVRLVGTSASAPQLARALL